MTDYNAWPIGNVPKEFQRPELDQIKELGYDWEDPRDVVDIFEKKVAKFAGSRYAVAVDCCTHGLFLALQCIKRYRKNLAEIIIPKNTYILKILSHCKVNLIERGCFICVCYIFLYKLKNVLFRKN